MNAAMPPSSAREALIVEALGEVALLLDRVESLTASMDSGRLALTDASSDLDERLKSYQAEMTSISQVAKEAVVSHIVKRAARTTQESIEVQSRAMHAAAEFAFSSQTESYLARLAKSLTRRMGRPWEVWLTHAATAAVAAAVTWFLVSSTACR